MRSFLSLSPILPRLVLVAVMLSAVPPAGAAENMANAIFLVARRGMSDPNFRETVVLVTHPPRGGPFGVIINRPLGQRLSEVFPDQSSLKGRKEVLYFGGPVGRQGLVFLVRSPNPPQGVMMVLRDVFFTSDTELIEGLFQRKEPLRGLRIFAGYSGWAPGQLQNELKRGGWHVVPADAESVFDKDPARLWQDLIGHATTRQTRSDEDGGVSREFEEGASAPSSRRTPAALQRGGPGSETRDEEAALRATAGTHHSSAASGMQP